MTSAADRSLFPSCFGGRPIARDPVIEASGVAGLRDHLLLDVRDPSAFASGHAPNAVRVPIETWEAAAKEDATSFDNSAYWEGEISSLGIDGRVPGVVYDDGRMTEAARVWFILQYFGADAFILNGGWPAIRENEAHPGARQTAVNGGDARFRARPGAGSWRLVDPRILKSELGGDLLVFDARTRPEFAGEDLRRNARGGHLPGAVSLPHTDLLDGTRLRSPAELRGLLAGRASSRAITSSPIPMAAVELRSQRLRRCVQGTTMSARII